MRLSIGVVGHVSRSGMGKALARQVGAQFISVDSGILGCDENHKMVLTHLSALGGDFAVVLEDDATPVVGFAEQLPRVLESAPPEVDVIGLYVGKLRPPQFQTRIGNAIRNAQATGAHWLLSRHMLHAVGYAIRTEHIPSLLAFDSMWPIDQHIGAWAATAGADARRVGYCWPSLVDHSDAPTLVAHPDGQPRIPGRTAWRTGTRTTWSSGSVVLT